MGVEPTLKKPVNMRLCGVGWLLIMKKGAEKGQTNEFLPA